MRRLVTGILAAGLLSGAISPAIAAGAASKAPARWALQHIPDAHGAALESISCPSATACTATGSVVRDGHIYRTAAEGWNGTAWSAEPTPAIPGGIDSFLRAVSCTAPASCTAVGDYWNGTGNVTLAETWNGTAWSIRSTPVIADSRSSDLFGVSCSAATACTAVGDFINTRGFLRTLAERWDGTAWSVQPTLNPKGSQQDVLEGVSCASARECIGVGQAAVASGASTTLAEAWNGSAWSVQPTPNPTGAQLSNLSGVSCVTTTDCVAVGTDSPGSISTSTLAETWNGTAWSIQPTPDSPGATATYLSGVFCTSAAACTASAYFLTHARNDVAMAEAWNGSKWSIQPAVRPASAVDSFLDDVSCTSAIDCIAVGDYTTALAVTEPLAERHSAG
jgi:hypothetical protein